MTIRRMVSVAICSTTLALAACAGPSQTVPPAAEQVHPAWLTGTWQGTAFQVATSNNPGGEIAVTLTFADGGAWTAMSGASGTSWLVGNRVMLDGTSPNNAGRVRYTLKERKDPDGAHELWGIADASFGAAAVSLKKIR